MKYIRRYTEKNQVYFEWFKPPEINQERSQFVRRKDIEKNIAQDCGIDYRTVKDYFEILNDTLIGYLIPGFTSTMKRLAFQTPKFYFFDVGIANYLLNRKNILLGTKIFGHSFEQSKNAALKGIESLSGGFPRSKGYRNIVG